MNGTPSSKLPKRKPLKSAPTFSVMNGGNSTNTIKLSLSSRSIPPAPTTPEKKDKELETEAQAVLKTNANVSNLHGMILEYFEVNGLRKAYNAFIEDCISYGLSVPETSNQPNFPAITKFTTRDALLLLKYFDSMDGENTFRLWMKYCADLNHDLVAVEGHNITELTLFMRIYVASIPFRMNTEDDVKIREKALIELREFHEQNIEKFTKHPICLPFFAFPFVVDPRDHDAFKIIFSVKWKDELRQKIQQVLEPVKTQRCSENNSLFNMYSKSFSQTQNQEQKVCNGTGKENEPLELENAKTQIKKLKEGGAKIKDTLILCENQYYKLLRFTQNLVGALQRAVKGEPQDLSILEKQIGETLPEIIQLGGLTGKCPMSFVENGSGEYIGAGFVRINRTEPCTPNYFSSSCESGDSSDAELIIDPVLRLSTPMDDISKQKFCALTGFLPDQIKIPNGSGDERINIASAPNSFSEPFPEPPRTYCIPPEKSLLLSSGLNLNN